MKTNFKRVLATVVASATVAAAAPVVATAAEGTYKAYDSNWTVGDEPSGNTGVPRLFVVPTETYDNSQQIPPIEEAELVYCFNQVWHYPTWFKNGRSQDVEYNKIPNADADTFYRLANEDAQGLPMKLIRENPDNSRTVVDGTSDPYPSYASRVSAEELKNKVLNVVYNGFDQSHADRAGIQKALGLSDIAFHKATQLAIWHFTENRPEGSSVTNMTPDAQTAYRILIGEIDASSVEGVELKDIADVDEATLNLFENAGHYGYRESGKNKPFQHLLSGKFVKSDGVTPIDEEPTPEPEPQPSPTTTETKTETAVTTTETVTPTTTVTKTEPTATATATKTAGVTTTTVETTATTTTTAPGKEVTTTTTADDVTTTTTAPGKEVTTTTTAEDVTTTTTEPGKEVTTTETAPQKTVTTTSTPAETTVTTTVPVVTKVENAPYIGTKATDKADGDKKLEANGGEIVDTIDYIGLKPGEEYTMKGELMEKDKDGNVTPTGIVAETTFTPEESEGSIDVEFTVPEGYEGKTLVVFEELEKDGEVVADHKKPESVSQTVVIGERTPLIGTIAHEKDSDESDKIIDNGKVIDKVEYTNFIPGKEYTIKGELINYRDGKPSGIKAEKTFIPEEANGVVELEFEIPEGYGTEVLVAFETAYDADGNKVADHVDLNDGAQTIATGTDEPGKGHKDPKKLLGLIPLALIPFIGGGSSEGSSNGSSHGSSSNGGNEAPKGEAPKGEAPQNSEAQQGEPAEQTEAQPSRGLLASTGANVWMLVLVGIVLLGIGGALAFRGRRES